MAAHAVTEATPPGEVDGLSLRRKAVPPGSLPLVPLAAFRQLKRGLRRHQSTPTPPHQRRPHQLATAARSRPRWSSTSLCPPECRCTSGSAGPTARAGSEPRRRVGSRLPQLPNRWLDIGAEGPRHPSCRLPRGDGRVGRAPSGGRGPYPHLTTRGVAGPSLHRGGLLRAEPRRALNSCMQGLSGGRSNIFFAHAWSDLTGECEASRC